MTPDEVAKNFYGECALPDDSKGWCVIHESRWPSMTHQYCKEMTDLVDLAEQAVEGYQADLRASVMALKPYDDGRISKGLVIAMIDGDVD